jgi:hypothetical protein
VRREDVAIEDDAVSGLIGRGEVAVLDLDQLGERAEVGERAAVDVLEDVGVGRAAEQLAGESSIMKEGASGTPKARARVAISR